MVYSLFRLRLVGKTNASPSHAVAPGCSPGLPDPYQKKQKWNSAWAPVKGRCSGAGCTLRLWINLEVARIWALAVISGGRHSYPGAWKKKCKSLKKKGFSSFRAWAYRIDKLEGSEKTRSPYAKAMRKLCENHSRPLPQPETPNSSLLI